MSEAQATAPSGERESADERLRETGLATRLLRRPELGALAGLVLVTLFFVTVANPAMFSLAGIMNFMAPPPSSAFSPSARRC